MAEETLKEVLRRNQVDAYELAMRSYLSVGFVAYAIEGNPIRQEGARKIKQAIWDAGMDYRGAIPTFPDKPETLTQIEEEHRLVCT